MEALCSSIQRPGLSADLVGTSIGIASACLAFGLYTYGHLYGLSERNIRILSCTTGFFSLGMLVKGISGLSHKIRFTE